MNKLNFYHDYNKLNYPFFPTIRRYDRYSLGSIVQVNSPSKTFEARIILKTKMTLSNIPTWFLCFDTETINRDEALETLNSFYQKTIHPLENLTILFLERCDNYE